MKNKIIQIWYWILPIILIGLYIYKFTLVNKNLNTAYDEGYYFLSLINANQGHAYPSLSQFFRIIFSICGDHFPYGILSLRQLSFALVLLTIFLFGVLTSYYLIYKQLLISLKSKVFYFCLVFCIGFVIPTDEIVSYNELQSFLISTMVGLYLITTVKSDKVNRILYVFIGFIGFLSILNIPPSGILISFALTFGIFINNLNKKSQSFKAMLFLIIGFILSILYFHYFVLDLKSLYLSINQSFNSIPLSSRGYGPSAHLVRLGFYFRDLFLNITVLGGLFVFSKFISERRYYIGLLFFVIGYFILLMYQKKPPVYYTSIFPLFVSYFILSYIKASNKLRISISYLPQLIVLLAPLIAAIGTNVHYSVKMICFLLPWTVIIYELICFRSLYWNHKIVNGFLIVSFVLPIILSVVPSMMSSQTYHYFKADSPVSGMYFTEKQYVYFTKVRSILDKYNFTAQKDHLFATTTDHMTILVFNALPCGAYQSPIDFLADKDKNLIECPEFLVLNWWDVSLLSSSFQSLGWNFPHGYDRFSIGTPDTNVDKWLYCKKDKLILK